MALDEKPDASVRRIEEASDYRGMALDPTKPVTPVAGPPAMPAQPPTSLSDQGGSSPVAGADA